MVKKRVLKLHYYIFIFHYKVLTRTKLHTKNISLFTLQTDEFAQCGPVPTGGVIPDRPDDGQDTG